MRRSQSSRATLRGRPRSALTPGPASPTPTPGTGRCARPQQRHSHSSRSPQPPTPFTCSIPGKLSTLQLKPCTLCWQHILLNDVRSIALTNLDCSHGCWRPAAWVECSEDLKFLKEGAVYLVEMCCRYVFADWVWTGSVAVPTHPLRLQHKQPVQNSAPGGQLCQGAERRVLLHALHHALRSVRRHRWRLLWAPVRGEMAPHATHSDRQHSAQRCQRTQTR